MAQNSPTVVVGCKLPNGIILDVDGKRITLNGANTTHIIGGYGLTTVDAAFFAAWLKAHAESPLVKKNIIFAQEKEVNAKAQAAETREVETGLEPIAPDTPVPGVSQAVPLDPGQTVEKFNPKS